MLSSESFSFPEASVGQVGVQGITSEPDLGLPSPTSLHFFLSIDCMWFLIFELPGDSNFNSIFGAFVLCLPFVFSGFSCQTQEKPTFSPGKHQDGIIIIINNKKSRVSGMMA